MARRRALSVAVSIAALAALACACSDAKVNGGDARFDAAAPTGPAGPGVSGGSTWAELYRDYFGPTGRASCAGDGACHGSSDQPGAQASGYVCAGGQDGCYSGITNPKTRLVVPGDTTTPPEKTGLHIILRKSDGTGIMPKRPEFVFADADMRRIDAWIASGAPNDAPNGADASAPSDAGRD